MKIIACEQYTDAWWKARRGIPTASEFHRIITPGKGDYSTAADKYMAEIIAAALGWKASFEGNEDTDRGRRIEGQSIDWLAMRHKIIAEPVGFVLSECGTYGSSPDSMVVGSGKPIEAKAPDLHTFIGWRKEMMKDRKVPEKHRAQCHGHMLACETDECLFVACNLHPYVDNIMIPVKRDEFTDKLEKHLARFTKELRALEEEVLGENVEEYRDGLAKGRAEALLTPPPSER